MINSLNAFLPENTHTHTHKETNGKYDKEKDLILGECQLTYSIWWAGFHDSTAQTLIANNIFS